MLWNVFCVIPSLLWKLTYSNNYQEMNVILHFCIFLSVLLKKSVMLPNAFYMIPSWLQKLTSTNNYQNMKLLLHFWIFYSVLNR